MTTPQLHDRGFLRDWHWQDRTLSAPGLPFKAANTRSSDPGPAFARREAEGAGCYIDLSQTEALLSTMVPYLLQAQVAGAQPGPLGNVHPAMAPHGIYPAAGRDQWLTIAVTDDRQWAAFAQLAGRRTHGSRRPPRALATARR